MKLELVKSDHFGEVAVDVYSDGNEGYMTRLQVGEGLGYENARDAIKDIHNRHRERLDKPEFSVKRKLRSTADGKLYDTYFYTRKGIMEICRYSNQPKADAFMDWAWEVIDSLMRGETRIVSMTDYQRMMAETRQNNIRIRKAQLLNKIAGDYDGTYKQVLQAYATKELTGEMVLPLPDAPQPSEYTATQIGEMLGGVTKDKIGRIANQNGLKTAQYGRVCVDKSPYSVKEVKTFRYNDAAIPEFKRILGIV